MEQLRVLDDVKPTEKIYNEKNIALGTLVGGPMAGGYFLIENYKSLGKGSLTAIAWGITIISTIAYHVTNFLMQDWTNISTIPLIFICVIVVRQFFKQKQKTDVDAYINQGGEVHSNWRVAGISLLFLAITIGISGIIAMYSSLEKDILIPPPPPRGLVESRRPARSSTGRNLSVTKSAVARIETKSYGAAAHVIIYNNFFFTELQIDSIAEQLIALDFFDAKNQKHVYLEKVLFDYEFSITDASADMTNERTKAKYEKLSVDLETFFGDGKVSILLMDEALEEVLERFGKEL